MLSYLLDFWSCFLCQEIIIEQFFIINTYSFSPYMCCIIFMTLHMNSIRVGLDRKEIINGLRYEYLLKMMDGISLNFIY